jgi:type IV pilus assembly protein PilC
MLSKVATIFEQEVDDLVDGLTSLLEPLIMVVLGVLVGGIVPVWSAPTRKSPDFYAPVAMSVGTLIAAVAAGWRAVTVECEGNPNPAIVPSGFLQLAALESILVGVTTLSGVEQPDPGTGFTQGAGDVGAARDVLASADPDSSSWSGEAADAYAAKNQQQTVFVGTMQAADTTMADITASQAELVRVTHDILYGLCAIPPILGAIWSALCAKAQLSELVDAGEQMATLWSQLDKMCGATMAVAVADIVSAIAGDAAFAVRAKHQHNAYGDAQSQAAVLLTAVSPVAAPQGGSTAAALEARPVSAAPAAAAPAAVNQSATAPAAAAPAAAAPAAAAPAAANQSAAMPMGSVGSSAAPSAASGSSAGPVTGGMGGRGAGPQVVSRRGDEQGPDAAGMAPVGAAGGPEVGERAPVEAAAPDGNGATRGEIAE